MKSYTALLQMISHLFSFTKILFLIVILLTACNEKEETFLAVSTDSFSLKAEGEEVKVLIQANTQWQITGEESWIEVDQVQGIGTQEITLDVSANSTGVERIAKLLVTADNLSQTLYIKQSYGYLDIKNNQIIFDVYGNPVELKIESSHKWKIIVPDEADWCYIDLLEGNGDDIVILTPKNNPNNTRRDEEVSIFVNCLDTQHEIKISQQYAYADGDYHIYQTFSAPDAKKPVHLVILGDGFTKEDYTESGTFDQAAETAIEAFLGVEPYTTYRNYFTVYKVVAHSEESGATVQNNISLSVRKQTRNTVFNSTLEGGGSTGISCNYNKVFRYAQNIPAIPESELVNTTIIVIINLKVYAGTCLIYTSGESISMCPMGPTFEAIVNHEAGGHGFAKLLDEYIYYEDASFPSSYSLQSRRSAAGGIWNWGANLSLTGNSSQVHWNHYIGQSSYEEVGMFEGGYMYGKNIWRPEYNSCMNNNIPYYNAPSREAIVRRIMTISGKGFNYDEFYRNDHITTNTYGAMQIIREDFIPLAPPVIMESR